MKILTLIILSFSVITIFQVKGQVKRNLTAEDMWQMDDVGAPVVSPDGKFSLLTLKSYDIEEDESSTFIYLLDNESG